MINFLMAACGAAANTAENVNAGCYNWPVIKQIITFFGWILEYIFKFFDMIGIGNIGLVIIVFTLLVKFVLLPLTIKQQKSAKLNSIIQPEIKAIQNKYKGKNDSLSMQAQQMEIKQIYAKYGTSQASGCLQTGIQMPIIIALFGALRQLPLVLDVLAQPIKAIADILAKSGLDFSTVSANLATGVDLNNRMSAIYSLSAKGWEAISSMLPAAQGAQVAELHNKILSVNTFLGMDIAQTPLNLIKGGGIGVVAIILPIIAGLSQWLSFKLTQTKESAASKDSMSAMSNSMGLAMPLFSVFLCLTMNTGLGLYWAASSLFQVVLQIIINKSYRKMDMDEFVKKNMEKAREKEERQKAKNRKKKGNVSAGTLISAANTNAKVIEKNSNSLASKANVNVNQEVKTDINAHPNSLAAKASMVSQFNKEQGEVIEDGEIVQEKTKRKYKK
ncbi:MAG: YidC/Oxa1 family membrane protein insertase [Lachnospiraceae bacterium]|nr:YidC/Oxa1 family membrane protein insertase [Lachnospiraceae bacterium]